MWKQIWANAGGMLLLLSLLSSGNLCSQCGFDPLCGEDPQSGVELMANPDGPYTGQCFNGVPFYVVYEFTTSDFDGNQDAEIVVSNVAYPDLNLGSIQGLFLEPNTSFPGIDPCDLSLAVFPPCFEDTLGFNAPLVTLQPNTTYFFIVGSNTEGTTFDIEISGPAVDIDACCDTYLSLGTEYTVESVEGGTDYQWFPTDQLDDFQLENPTIRPQESLTLTVTGTVGDCRVTDEIFIEVGPPIVPPNTITPNGDGINDFWEIAGIEQFQTATVSVYDRWGQQVFNSIGYAEPWDGKNNGRELPTATYYYMIELRDIELDIPPVAGYITLVH